MAYSDLLLVLKSLEELEFGDPLSTDLAALIATCRRYLADDPTSTDARKLLHLLRRSEHKMIESPASQRERDRRSSGHAS